MTISKIVQYELCTGCGTCASLCPQKSIKFIKSQTGILIPNVDSNSCNGCEICSKVCPGYDIDFKKLNEDLFGKDSENLYIGNYLKCYLGYSKDYNIRHYSSSGGIVTELLIYALENKIIDGAVVTRMNDINPLEAESFIATTKEEIINASKSKYCPVPVNLSLKQIIETNDDTKFAIVGLPCHIHGVRKAEQFNPKLKNKIVIHIGIFCGHTPNYNATKFLCWQIGINEKTIERLSYRGNGWPGEMQIVFNDCQTNIKYEEYWNMGFGKYFFPRRCTLCQDGVAELADISIGDAWLNEIRKNDREGTSIIICRTKNIEVLLENCFRAGKIELNNTTASKVIESQKYMLIFKKRYTTAHRFISRIQRKKIPSYSSKSLLFTTKQFIDSLFLLFFSSLASNKKTWGILKTYIYIKRILINVGVFSIEQIRTTKHRLISIFRY